eukprot:8508410-Alexandrium_andersonii.AAC.1
MRASSAGRIEPHKPGAQVHDAECVPLTMEPTTLSSIDGFNVGLGRHNTKVTSHSLAKRRPE